MSLLKSKIQVYINKKAETLLNNNSVQWIHIARRAIIPPLSSGSYNFLVWDIINTRTSKDLIICNYNPKAFQNCRNSDCAVIQVDERNSLLYSSVIKRILVKFFNYDPYKSTYPKFLTGLFKKSNCKKVLVWSNLNLTELLKLQNPELSISFAQRRFEFPKAAHKYNFCDFVIFQCPSQVNAALEYSSPLKSQYTVIPNGVELDLFTPATETQKVNSRAKLKIPLDKFVVVFPSRLDPQKGIIYLHHWIKFFQDNQPDIHFLLPGPFNFGKENNSTLKVELEDLITTSENVTWLKGIPRKNMPQILHASDICLMTGTVKEGFSMACIEAMASGLPTISINKGCYIDIIKNNYNGIKFPPEEIIQDTINSITKLFLSKDLTNRLGKNSRLFAKSMLSRKKVIKNFDNFLEGEYNKINSRLDFEAEKNHV